ncbi:RND transporter [Aliiroseovarius sp. F20344]|uniref:RND transporter n=1 Tax=Aliiroseovarius sp. F20344 TaxID=2926414 RepID=UPI001FF40AB2|nr:RND transporter [Aliiroseovarius sp. F20344]MCK0143334.1 RND transporter [Aliiroseovarius sp. F20344]
MSIIDEMPFSLILVACLTLGLAPFAPPHIWEKLGMLFSGTLTKPVDIFDFLLHGMPWIILVLKLFRLRRA